VRGQPWITNDVVNGIGTAAGAVVGALLLSPQPQRGELRLSEPTPRRRR
jgi:hypothetical protein